MMNGPTVDDYFHGRVKGVENKEQPVAFTDTEGRRWVKSLDGSSWIEVEEKDGVEVCVSKETK